MNYIDTEERPWGSYFVIHDEKNYKIKRIEVKIGQRLSYQYHNKRSEVWTIISGQAQVTLNGTKDIYNEGDTVIIPVGTKHRVKNIGQKKLIFIEVQTGTYFGEDDIVRIQDDYKRI